jgi:hypothetical protein
MISLLQDEMERLFGLISDQERKTNRALRLKTEVVRKKLLYLKSFLGPSKAKENVK